MIYTRWGNPVKIVAIDESRARVTVEYQDGQERELEAVDFASLRADGGINEIAAAVDCAALRGKL